MLLFSRAIPALSFMGETVEKDRCCKINNRSQHDTQNSTGSCFATPALFNCRVRKQSLLLAFLVISVTWSFHVRSFVIVRPSNFVLVTNSNSFPSMMTGSKTLCSLAKEILSSLHLSAFSCTLFSRDHSITLLAIACQLVIYTGYATF